MSTSAPNQDAPSGGFFTWLRSLGIVRSRNRWFAGVAGGIAARAGIDPLIVRGIFVVLTLLAGPGLLVYLAAWLLLPDDSGRIHVEEVVRGRASAGVIITAVILVALLVVPGLFALPWGWSLWNVLPSWLGITLAIAWWAVIVPALVIWFIIWLSRSGWRADPTTAKWAQHTGARAAEWGEQAGQRAATWGEQAGKRATEWGQQAGGKAEAWGQKVDERSRDWQRQAREQHAARRLGAAYVVLTLACALLAAGIIAIWALIEQAPESTVLTLSITAALAVLGTAMIIAGIRGRNSGWIGFLAAVGILSLIFAPVTTVLPDHTRVVPFGHATTTLQGDSPGESLVMVGGNVTVDLTELEADDGARAIDVWLLGGNVTVQLPTEHPTQIDVNLLAGNVRDSRIGENGQRQGGIFVTQVIDSGSRSRLAEVTTVRVRLFAGNVRVEGGSTRSEVNE